ncbi:Gfo/Idh/MocA family protein [Occultella aeris]|uniref:Putative oxidoreductase YcjS n=1 Tax=Occultella aeris TaxID=2761496 RepID=A0A7M4DD72_9MICO|nr:Gfo/Idh/MocA family oxidoreductase [Occultella aeris]VZO34791.1 putative oxidoreductase YcjS [Occultella aeris]
MTTERRRRVGLVGCGEVAGYGHLPALLRAERLELVGVCDLSTDRLAAAPAPAGVARCTSLDEMPDLDALVITSPAGAHAQNVRWAARRGVPVLCEKPIAVDEATSVAMVEQMEAASIPLWVAFNYRFSPVAQRIHDLVATGAVGEVRALRMVFLWDLHGAFQDRVAQKGVNQRRVGRMLEGGPLVDCGVHQIDLARWWLGSDLQVDHATGVWFDEIDGVDAPEHVTTHLSGGGARVLVDVSFAYGHRSPSRLPTFTYEVIGTDGVIRYRREERDFVLIDSDGLHDLGWAHEKSFEGMYADLAAALHGEEHALPTGRDGLAATRLALEATARAVAAR